MSKYLLLISILLQLIQFHSYSQSPNSIESETHIYWQKSTKLDVNDFQGDPTQYANSIKFCEDHKLCTMASLGLFAVLDIPSKKRNRGKLQEKVYIAPAFEKSTSYSFTDDSIEIAKQALVFDIFEVSARFARQQLSMLQDSMPGYGTLTLFLKTIEARADKMRTAYIDAYTKEVYIDSDENAYEKWRVSVDSLLVQSQEFATSLEECHRFIKGEPIADGYIMADQVVGNLDTKSD